MLYVVRFVRSDCKPDEEYYYQSEKDAMYHFNLFIDDSSNLYDCIIVETTDGKIITRLEF